MNEPHAFVIVQAGLTGTKTAQTPRESTLCLGGDLARDVLVADGR